MRLLTCLGMMSVLLLTFTVSSGFVSNGYHKGYARGNLDALGTKIRESINNQITEELSDSAGLTPSSPPSPTSSTPYTLTLTITGRDNFAGKLTDRDTRAGIGGATIALFVQTQGGVELPLQNCCPLQKVTAVTDDNGNYGPVKGIVSGFFTARAQYGSTYSNYVLLR
jgi:hypothetical protein